MGILGIKQRTNSAGASTQTSDVWAGTRQRAIATGTVPAMFRPRVFQVPSLGDFARIAPPAASSTAGSLSTVVESAKRKVNARPSDNGTGVSI